ncbi:hypothetical protein LCGC14_2887450 [marine sediment metagenome]|uniref:GAF domain-containing protein n=1 Tax=marine sediment metagenome TaxID=412755 RepID=A0A0F8YK31_9ZZZZ
MTNKEEIVGILSLKSAENLLTEEALKQLQEIINLALEPLFEFYVTTGEIALTRKTTGR